MGWHSQDFLPISTPSSLRVLKNKLRFALLAKINTIKHTFDQELDMDNPRFAETGKSSFFSEYIYD
jgi:hypothetical protein